MTFTFVSKRVNSKKLSGSFKMLESNGDFIAYFGIVYGKLRFKI